MCKNTNYMYSNYIYIKNIDDCIEILLEEATMFVNGKPNRIDKIIPLIPLEEIYAFLEKHKFHMNSVVTSTLISTLARNKQLYDYYNVDIKKEISNKTNNDLLNSLLEDIQSKVFSGVENAIKCVSPLEIVVELDQADIVTKIQNILSSDKELYQKLKTTMEELSERKYTDEEFIETVIQKALVNMFDGCEDIIVDNTENVAMYSEEHIDEKVNDLEKEIEEEPIEEETIEEETIEEYPIEEKDNKINCEVIQFPKERQNDYMSMLPDAEEIEKGVRRYNEDGKIKSQLEVISKCLIEAMHIGKNYIVTKELREDVIYIVKAKGYYIVPLEDYEDIFLISSGKVKKSEMPRVAELAQTLSELNSNI